VFLQEAKMEFISRDVFCSLWGCQHVDLCYLGLRGASRGILLMWDRRMVEKIEDCVGTFWLRAPLEMLVNTLSGLLHKLMVQMTMIGKCFGKNWLGL